MLSLPYQISSNNFSVCITIGNNQTVSWTGDHINSHTPKQNTLSFGNKLVSRAYNNICFRQTKKTKSHRSHTLNSSHGQNLISTTKVGGIYNCGSNTSVFVGWRTRSNMLASSNFSRGNCHYCTRNVAVASTRHVTTGSITGNTFLPCNQARYNLCFKISNSATLSFGKSLNIGMGKLNILLQLFRHQITGYLNFVICKN